MEIIRIAGYTDVEKLNIAKRYLVTKQREANGLGAENFEISDNAILALIHRYTSEKPVSGSLERRARIAVPQGGGGGPQGPLVRACR
jgi:ATP-dependent Lon protease